MTQPNNPFPVYWFAPEHMMMFSDGKSEPIEMSIACDPASWEGDYGCKSKYKKHPDGTLEIISIEYTKSKKKRKKRNG